MEWEYRVVVGDIIDGSEGERTLNEYGSDDWELVSESDHRTDRFKTRTLKRWIFKRPKEYRIYRNRKGEKVVEEVSDSTQAFIDKL